MSGYYGLRVPEKVVEYISAIPSGNTRQLSSAVRLDNYTGQLALNWAQITREDLEMYIQYYRRKNSPAMTSLLPSMAEKVLSSYIRYYIASLNHGKAIAAAPRRFGEESQAVTLENVPVFFGLTTAEEMVPARKNFEDQELQRINAIVRDNPELAARLGLTESGSNKGPNVDVVKARAAIAAAPDAVFFREGHLPLGSLPGMASSSAALPAPGMGYAGRAALPPPGLSGLLNMGSGASSAAMGSASGASSAAMGSASGASSAAMGSASGAASASGRNRALSLLGEGSGAAAAAAPAPAAAAAARPAAANNGRGTAAGKSRGRATGGPAGKRGRFGSLASVPENAAAEAAENAGAGAAAAAAAPAPGPSGGRRRRHAKTHRKSHRKTRKSHQRRRTHHRRR